MKSIQDLKNMQAEKEKIYNELKATEESVIKNEKLDIWDEFEKISEDFDKEEQIIILCTWIDFIDDLLDYNFDKFMDKHGYGEEEIEKVFSMDDENVLKETFITEEQAMNMLKNREKLCEEHPYGLVKNYYGTKGIYIERIEMDILKWFLEIE